MKKNLKKIISGAASATMLASQAIAMADTAVVQNEVASVAYDEVANVQGKFSFDQDTMTPADEIFSIFGTAATGVCAKPAFAMDETPSDEAYFVNVSGSIKREYATTLADMKEKGGTTKTIVCSCGMGDALAQATVTGVPVSEMLCLSGLSENANAVSFKSADGYKATLPLEYVLEKEAMLVWDVAGAENPAGLQAWMPSTVAKYFARQVTEVEVFHTDDEITVDGTEAKVSIINNMDEAVAKGEEITFSGFADDCGTAIAAIEFSMDGGKTWTTCKTVNADADRWVAWNFTYTPENAGNYKLDVRAVAANGTVSPLASSVVFEVI